MGEPPRRCGGQDRGDRRLVQRGEDGLHAGAGDVGDRDRIDVRSQHGGRRDEGATRRGEPVEPVPDRIAHPVRQLTVGRGHQPPSELTDEEGVAVGTPADGGHHRAGHLPPGHRGQLSGDLRLAQPGQPDPRDRRLAAERGNGGAERLLPGGLGVPVRRDHHQPGRRHARGEVHQQPYGRRVRPVQIVEHHQQTARSGRGHQGLGGGLEQPEPLPRRPVATGEPTGQLRRRELGRAPRKTWRNGQYGGLPTSSLARPRAQASPSSRAWSMASSARRVLPTPGSPATSTTCRRPSSAERRQPASKALSATRPTSARPGRTPPSAPTLAVSRRGRPDAGGMRGRAAPAASATCLGCDG